LILSPSAQLLINSVVMLLGCCPAFRTVLDCQFH